jgi:PhnB protein
VLRKSSAILRVFAIVANRELAVYPLIAADAVLHARVSIGGVDLMAADIPNAEPMRSAYLSLSVDSDGEAERVFSALSEDGQVFMPMEETFFASRFGQLRDRFGINWMILHERPDH